MTRDPRWQFRVGYARQQLGDEPAARVAYERALSHPRRRSDWFHRLAESYEREEDWEGVARTYGAAVEDVPDQPEFHLAAARALERLHRWEEAAEHYAATGPGDDAELLIRLGEAYERALAPWAALAAYEAALSSQPRRGELWERAGVIRQELGDLEAAQKNYRRALEVGGDDAPPTVRLRLAQVLQGVGRWQAALELLEANLDRHPEHAPSYRTLARVATEIYTWGGSFQGPTASLVENEFHWLVQHEPAEGSKYLQLACWAMEHAVNLSPKRPNWLAQLAALRERSGYETGAISAYERALERARSSGQLATIKNVHHWEYGLERLRHQHGRGRVTDPHFDSEVVVVDEPVASPPDPAGVFTAHLDFAGLRITGLLFGRDVEDIEIRVDGKLLRTLRPSEEGFPPRLAYRVMRDTLVGFPVKSRLTVSSSDGRPLLARGRGAALELRLPHGTDTVAAVLARSGMLDKKGTLRPDPDELARRQAAYLELYEMARDFFDRELGTSIFLMYGTLLGLHRDGDFIPGDDDFDVGYVSEETNPEAVKEETKEIILRLVEAGYTVAFNRRGRLFRLQHPAEDLKRLHLDLRPLWFEDGRLWVHNYVSYPSSVEDFLPVEERTLRGTRVYVPRRTEAFLRAHYGPGWKVPDPSFTYHAGDVDPAVMAHLGRALITPPEYRELQRELERRQSAASGWGRLVSHAEQSLYPLEDFLD